MLVSDISAAVRVDLHDTDKALFTDDALSAFVRRAVGTVSLDLKLRYEIGEGGLISPEPDAATTELITIQACIRACIQQCAATANSIEFKSGDQSANLTSQPKQWGELRRVFEEAYSSLRASLLGVVEDNGIITPTVTGVVFKQGSAHHHASEAVRHHGGCW